MSTNFSIDALLNKTNHETKPSSTFYINPLFQTFLNQLQHEQTKSRRDKISKNYSFSLFLF
jgi:hypothetical protein